MGAVLPSDDAEVDAEARRTREAVRWTRALRDGAREDALATLDEVEARVLEDEEVICALGNAATDAALIALMHAEGANDGDYVCERACDVYATCVKRCPSGASFPARGLVQPGTFVVASVGSLATPTALRLRLPRQDRGVSAMVWHSSIALGRYVFRPEVRAWIDSFGRSRGRTPKCLEIGGGAMVAGLAFSCSFPDGGWNVVLSDVDENAVVNARYNIERQQKLQPKFNAKTGAKVVDWDADSDSSHSDSDSASNLGMFDIILGADVVHEEPHSHGVIRALKKYLDPNGVALIVNPAPASRGGADTFQQLLSDDTCWHVTKTRITNCIIRVGMEDETEDVPLDFYIIQKRASEMTQTPPLEVMR